MHLRSFFEEISAGSFVGGVLAAIIVLHAGAFMLYHFGPRIENNDQILAYQIEKLEQSRDRAIEAIIVGDSAAGNAIQADLFSKITGKSTIHVALTGSYGFVGSLNMVKQARRVHPEIQNVIIVHTLDMWFRPFSRQGFFKTSHGIDTGDIGAHNFVSYP
jgi:hypothetical protein